MRRDLYAVLDLPKKASVAEVKKAYKRLARKYHPDLNPSDKTAEERFKEISEAYAILSDPEKKKRYDTLGTTGDAPQGYGPPPGGVRFEGFDFDSPPGGAGGFADLFDSFVSSAQAGAPRGPRPGEDLVYPLTLTLQEAYSGKKTRLTVRHTVPCAACSGHGRLEPAKRINCSRCSGTGKVGLSRGPFSFAQPCPACHGTGADPGELCTACGGTGTREASETVEVSVPAGVDTGSRVRLRGKGQAGHRGGPAGDLFIETHVTADPLFQREGPHLRVKLPVTFPEAVLGAKVEVPTLAGLARLKIPPGTASGQVFRMRERGMPSPRGGAPGDLLVEVTVAVPSVVDEQSKELLREFEKLNPESPRSYTGPQS